MILPHCEGSSQNLKKKKSQQIIKDIETLGIETKVVK